MNKDSVYQQLRSHLAYLGLATVAEALPTHLDQARQHNIGHTEFLEQLLRVEVETTEQRRWETRLKLANFPMRVICGGVAVPVGMAPTSPAPFPSGDGGFAG